MSKDARISGNHIVDGEVLKPHILRPFSVSLIQTLLTAIPDKLPAFHHSVFEIDVGFGERGFPVYPLLMNPDESSSRVHMVRPSPGQNDLLPGESLADETTKNIFLNWYGP